MAAAGNEEILKRMFLEILIEQERLLIIDLESVEEEKNWYLKYG
ncbi:hypothetical protein Q5M85_03975 [Paraclostridium bifermentans]|nr:hypothetical protein [Paraclostridium bifermentans]